MMIDRTWLGDVIRTLAMGEREVQARAAEDILRLGAADEVPPLETPQDLGRVFTALMANALEPLTGERAMPMPGEERRMEEFVAAVADVFAAPGFPAADIALALRDYIVKAHALSMQFFADDEPEPELQDAHGASIFMASVRVFRNMGKGAATILPELVQTLDCSITQCGITSGLPAVHAMAAIGSMGNEALPYLPVLLEHYYEDGDEYTAKAMAGILRDSPDALEHVIAVLGTQDEERVECCCELLEATGSAAKAAVPELKRIALAGMETASRSAAKALRSIAGDDPGVEAFLISLRNRQTEDVEKQDDDDGVLFVREGRHLREWLMDMTGEDAETVNRACRMLCAMEWGIPHTDADLEDGDARERDRFPGAVRSVFAEPGFPAPEVFEAVAGYVVRKFPVGPNMAATDASWALEGAAMCVLENAGAPAAAAVKALLPVMTRRHQDTDSFLSIISDLGDGCAHAVADILRTVSAHPHGIDWNRYAGMLARLIRLNRESWPTLRNVLKDKQAWRQQVVLLHVIAELSSDARDCLEDVKKLSAAANGQIRGAAIDALAVLAPQCPETKRAVLASAHSEKEMVAVAGIRAMGRLADDESVFDELCCIATEAEDYWIRSAAVDGLGQSPLPFAKIAPVLRNALKDWDGADGISPTESALEVIRHRAADAAVLVPDLISMMEENMCDQDEVVSIFVNMGEKASEAIPLLERLLEEAYDWDPFGEEEETRSLQEAIRTIRGATKKIGTK